MLTINPMEEVVFIKTRMKKTLLECMQRSVDKIFSKILRSG